LKLSVNRGTRLTDSYTAEERALAKQMLDNAKRRQIAKQGISHARRVGLPPPAVQLERQSDPEDLLRPIVLQTHQRKGGCGKCGGPLDEITVGCNTCRMRHNNRRSRLRRRGIIR